MYEIAGLFMLLISAAGMLTLAIVTALHVRRLATRAKALRAHPMLDSEWLTRKRAVLTSLAESAQEMRDGLTRLNAAFATIARDLDDLATAAIATAGAVEDILNVSAPWLRGMFAQRRAPR
jgi:hypothetical protein